jgi:hypothetical protein
VPQSAFAHIGSVLLTHDISRYNPFFVLVQPALVLSKVTGPGSGILEPSVVPGKCCHEHSISAGINNLVDLFRRTPVIYVLQQMIPGYAFELVVEISRVPYCPLGKYGIVGAVKPGGMHRRTET